MIRPSATGSPIKSRRGHNNHGGSLFPSSPLNSLRFRTRSECVTSSNVHPSRITEIIFWIDHRRTSNYCNVIQCFAYGRFVGSQAKVSDTPHPKINFCQMTRSLKHKDHRLRNPRRNVVRPRRLDVFAVTQCDNIHTSTAVLHHHHHHSYTNCTTRLRYFCCFEDCRQTVNYSSQVDS